MNRAAGRTFNIYRMSPGSGQVSQLLPDADVTRLAVDPATLADTAATTRHEISPQRRQHVSCHESSSPQDVWTVCPRTPQHFRERSVWNSNKAFNSSDICRSAVSFTMEKTLTSSVTTDWRVHWDEDFIARDLLQNFYDANRDQVESIRVLVDGLRVTISAPTGYNLERLFYLGSEKQAGDIGQYGEGFKAAATCLLRRLPRDPCRKVRQPNRRLAYRRDTSSRHGALSACL